ncbi:hypothetical protein BGZ67_000854 [Mortierella alpina]|nr:hypothetical protein BGZ67_000854 [Mortierella alpina]
MATMLRRQYGSTIRNPTEKTPRSPQYFEEAAALTPALNQHLEGGENTALPIATEEDKTQFRLLVFNDSGDSDFHPENEKDQETIVSTLGGFGKPPEKFNWIVGPGESSLRLRTQRLWKVTDVNISQDLADRRSEVMLALEKLEDPDILAVRNFIYTPKLLQDVMSIDHWTEAMELWQREHAVNVYEEKLADIVSFVFSMHTTTTLSQAIARTRHMETTSPLHAVMQNYQRTTRDEILCGPSYKNEEKLYPDFFLSVKGHTIAIMEAKAPNRGIAGYRDDRRKLFDEMKLSVDGLLRSGVNASVVGFLISGQRVEVFAMSLRYEACYLVVDVGEFDLVTSRYQFGNIITAAGPLLTARKIIMETLEKLQKLSVASAGPISIELQRGTYHTAPCMVPDEQ